MKQKNPKSKKNRDNQKNELSILLQFLRNYKMLKRAIHQ